MTHASFAQQGTAALAAEDAEPKGDEPNPSLHNMRRLGFVQVASRLNLLGPTAAA